MWVFVLILLLGGAFFIGFASRNFSSWLLAAVKAPVYGPTNLIATQPTASSTTVRLTWQDKSTTESGFKIERGLATSSFSVIGQVATNTVQYFDSRTVASTTYYYRVRAFNKGGYSPYSNTASVTTH